MYTRHGPNLKSMTAAERDIVLINDVFPATHNAAERRVQRLAPNERRVSNAAILRGRREVIKLRAERVERNLQTETTVRQQHLSTLAAQLKFDIPYLLLNAVPAGGISVIVDFGEPPGVRTTREWVLGPRDRYGYRHRQTHCSYAITLGRGRTSSLNAAGLNVSSNPLTPDSVIDDRLILSARIIHQDDHLTVVSCATARVHKKYDLLLDEETKPGRIGTKYSFLAIWRCRGVSEERWHNSLKPALETLPSEGMRDAILNKTAPVTLPTEWIRDAIPNVGFRLTDEDINMLAEIGL